MTQTMVKYYAYDEALAIDLSGVLPPEAYMEQEDLDVALTIGSYEMARDGFLLPEQPEEPYHPTDY